MRSIQIIAIAVALSVTAILFYFVPTTAPKKSGKAAGAPAAPQVQPASTESVLAISKARLSPQDAAKLDSLDRTLAGKDSLAMVPALEDMAKVWDRNQQPLPAAFLFGLVGKLEKSQKRLNFAGQIFLELLHNEAPENVQLWKAQQARDLLEQALELNPNNDTAKIALASAYIDASSEPMKGVQLLLGIVREQPDNVPANLALGQMSIRSGQVDKAIGRFETVLKKEQANLEATLGLAEAYKMKGNKEQAIALFQKAKKIMNKADFSQEIDRYINSFKNN